MNNKDFVGRISGAIGLIFIGTVFLCINFGYFTFGDVLTFLFAYWPLFIVLAGIKILAGAFPFGRYINLAIDIVVDVVILAVLLSGVGLNDDSKFFNFVTTNRQVEAQELGDDLNISADKYEGITNVNYEFNVGAGEFVIDDSAGDDFLDVSGYYSKNIFVPTVDSGQDGDDLNIVFEQNSKNTSFFFPWGDVTNEFSFITTSAHMSNYEVNVGAGKGDINLSSQNFDELTLSVGAGDVEINITEGVKGKLSIDVGAGNVVVNIPKESGYKASYDVGVGEFKVTEDGSSKSSGGLGRKGSVESDNNEVILEFDVNVGAGKVEIILK